MATIMLAKYFPIEVSASIETHAQSIITAGKHNITIDEPIDRGGKDEGATPLEALLGAFCGCTNVIANRIADDLGIRLEMEDVQAKVIVDTDVLKFDNTVERPFPELFFTVSARTDASEEAMAQLRQRLEITCPVSALFKAAGTKISSEWRLAPIGAA